MYELVYGQGGHGGPYPDLVNAWERAIALLRGSRTLTVIYIVPRIAPEYTAEYAVRTVTKAEAMQPEYEI